MGTSGFLPGRHASRNISDKNGFPVFRFGMLIGKGHRDQASHSTLDAKGENPVTDYFSSSTGHVKIQAHQGAWKIESDDPAIQAQANGHHYDQLELHHTSGEPAVALEESA